MKSKEALEILVKQANERKLSNKIVANGIAVSLLEKLVERDTPMKFVKTPDWYYHCPNCKYEIVVSNVSFDTKQVYQYCYHCGQRLDWSDC